MTGLGYTVPAVVAVLAVCALELAMLRTGLFRRPGVLAVDGDRARFPDPGRWLADQAQRAHRHLRRSPDQRPALPVRHSRSRISCSASRWSPRCCWYGNANVRVGEAGPPPATAGRVRRRSDRLRPAGGRQPRLPPATADSPRAACACPTAARAYGCSMPGAAPARRRPRCWPSPPRPTSSPSTRRAACSTRRPAKTWPPSVRFVHTPVERTGGARRHRTVRRHPGRLFDPQPRRPGRPIAETSACCCGPAPPWRCTNTRCATPPPPPASGTPCAGASSFPPAGGEPVTRRCTAICGAACWRSTAQHDFGPRLRRCGLHRGAQRDDARLGAQHRAHLPGGRAAMTGPGTGRRTDRPTDRRRETLSAATGLPDAGHLPSRPRAVVVGGGIAGLTAATGLAERGVAVEVDRTRALPRRSGRRLDRAPGRRRPRDESRLPRVFPPVLQPAGPTAPHRSAPADADARQRLSAHRRGRPARHLPWVAAHPAVERAGVRAAQPDVPASRLPAHRRPRGRAAGRGVGARHLSTGWTTSTPRRS